jgi:hypothetical protein
MDTSYQELKEITDQYYTDWQMPAIKTFIDLLNKHGVGLRNKDGDLHEATFSIPKSIPIGIVLGMRYKKIDESYSEDLYLFQPEKKVISGYRGELEKILPEYKNTHKLKPNT